MDYHDPFVREFTEDGHTRRSVALTPEAVAGYDAVMVVTDHTGVDYAMVARQARCVVDTRHALPKGG